MAELIEKQAALDALCEDCKRKYGGMCPHEASKCIEYREIKKLHSIEADLIDRNALILKQKEHADLFADSTAHDDIVRRDEAMAALAEIINAPAVNSR